MNVDRVSALLAIASLFGLVQVLLLLRVTYRVARTDRKTGTLLIWASACAVIVSAALLAARGAIT